MSDEDCEGLLDVLEAIATEPKELDFNALNEACWTFLSAWREHTDQKISPRTWNNLKPVIRATITDYLKKCPK